MEERIPLRRCDGECFSGCFDFVLFVNMRMFGVAFHYWRKAWTGGSCIEVSCSSLAAFLQHRPTACGIVAGGPREILRACHQHRVFVDNRLVTTSCREVVDQEACSFLVILGYHSSFLWYVVLVCVFASDSA